MSICTEPFVVSWKNVNSPSIAFDPFVKLLIVGFVLVESVSVFVVSGFSCDNKGATSK